MRWSIETLITIAQRVARLAGAHSDEAYPICRVRDRRLIAVYIRGRGRIPA